jgi:hypothetical protein
MTRAPFLFGVLLALLGSVDLAAQTIPTAPSYLPGQQYTLRLNITTEDVRDHPPQKKYEAPITLRVLRKGTDGTILDWMTGKSSAATSEERSDPILELAENIFENLHVVVHLDAAGKYQGIQNEDELKAKIQEFEVLLIPQATAKIADLSERARMAEAMSKAMTPATMLSAAREEVDLYFGLSGLPLEAGKPLRIKSSALNPFGKLGTLDGEMQIIPVNVDSEKAEARVEFQQEFDPSGTAASRKNLVFGSQPAPAENLTLTDSGEYVLDLASGRVKQVRHVRTIRQNGAAVRTETTDITVR